MSSIPTHKKVHVAHAYIISKGAHHASTWPALSESQLTTFGKPIFQMYRNIVLESWDMHKDDSDYNMKTNADIMFDNGFLSPASLVRRVRLALFTRLVIKQVVMVTDLVFALQHVKKSWAHVVFSDLHMIAMLNVHPSFSSGALFTSLVEWASHVATIGKKFFKVIAQISLHPLLNVPLVGDRVGAVGHASLALGEGGVYLHPCTMCEKSFPTLQKMTLHAFKTHGVKNIYRQYVGPNWHCLVCMKMFWSRERVVNHIRYRSKICRNQMLTKPPPYTSEQADAFDLEEAKVNRELSHRGSRRHKAVKPCVQLVGPIMPISTACPSKHHPLGRGHNYWG